MTARSLSTRKAAPVGEVIAIGSEMLFSNRVDTNSLYIAAQLEQFGVPLIAKSIVGDDPNVIKKALGLALTRADFIFLSGGLGPTEDDLTRHAVSELLGRELVYREEIVDQIRRRFQKLGRPMHEINKRQGFILENAVALDNPNGTAPGQHLRHEGRQIFLLPGPPRELQPMVVTHLIPLLTQLGLRRAAKRHFRVAGLPESQVDALVAPLYRAYPEIRSTILAAPGDIELFFFAEEEGPRLAELGQKVAEVLGESIYATEEVPLEEALVRLLRSKGATLSVAESCTGGMLGEWVTRVAGSSEVFPGGVIAYSNLLKTKLLDVPEKLLRTHGAVSAPVAEAMADGIRCRTSSTYGLAITGIAGPGGGTAAKPVGSVFIGCSREGKTIARELNLLGDREVIRTLSTRAALNLLRIELLHSEKKGRKK